MLTPQYLKSLQYSSLPKVAGIYALKHPRKSGSWYYVSTYNVFRKYKNNFFSLTEAMGQKENVAKWDMHHIVERQHLVNFVEPAMLNLFYETVWPCILIHKSEHSAYNSMLHIKETEIIFPLGAPGKGNIQNLRLLYKEVYDGNRVLKQIAQNVIDDIAQRNG